MITADVPANYRNVKWTLAEKKLSSQKSAKANLCCANTVSEQRGSKIWQLVR